ncbi:MAG TPA: molybdopterin-dependent oxidoreductase [Phycisphaerales bacterium]|nr:molybdopterin-dependent oxidoreductase [Phycisphaerales bacterium]
MPSITINGVKCEFTPGQMILQVANANGVEIPQYCYHDGLSIVASCRICLAEAQAPDPKTGQLTPYMGGKLFPTCQTPAADGMVVSTDSPKASANQRAVMEYLLINHPLDCPVCDQSGECFLQDYSYQYGRGVSRFEEQKVKQPKKDLGPHVLLYSDRCIMCTRCVRFTREVTGTSELLVAGRGNKEEIDVFPGVPLANELSANVIDLCPVGALLDKDFLFAQRVWFLKATAGIDPLTASGDNIWIHHNEGKVYRLKPRENLKVNKWWMTDEVRYGWKFVHSESRLRSPMRRQHGALVECDYTRAYDEILSAMKSAVAAGKRVAVMLSPMIACEEAYLLAKFVAGFGAGSVIGVGPVPVHGHDKVYPQGAKEDDPKAFKIVAEKAPNARGVKRAAAPFSGNGAIDYHHFLHALGAGTGKSDVGAVLLVGGYPSEWMTNELRTALSGKFVALIDILASDALDAADIVLPGATFAEKSGTFENWRGLLQAFDQAVPVIEMAKSEGQIALDLITAALGIPAPPGGVQPVLVQSSPGQVPAGAQVALPRVEAYDAAKVRAEMAGKHPALAAFASGVSLPPAPEQRPTDMTVVEF